MQFDNYICKDKEGNILLSVDRIEEEVLSDSPLLTHCLAVVKIGNDYLFGLNKWRNRFEIFGGCREKGETARECIIRECCEETGLNATDIKYIGAVKLLLKPDYYSSEERIELGGLYGISLPEQDLMYLEKNIRDKDEIISLALYSKIRDRETIAEIDEKLTEFF